MCNEELAVPVDNVEHISNNAQRGITNSLHLPSTWMISRHVWQYIKVVVQPCPILDKVFLQGMHSAACIFTRVAKDMWNTIETVVLFDARNPIVIVRLDRSFDAKLRPCASRVLEGATNGV